MFCSTGQRMMLLVQQDTCVGVVRRHISGVAGVGGFGEDALDGVSGVDGILCI